MKMEQVNFFFAFQLSCFCNLLILFFTGRHDNQWAIQSNELPTLETVFSSAAELNHRQQKKIHNVCATMNIESGALYLFNWNMFHIKLRETDLVKNKKSDGDFDYSHVLEW